MFESINSGREKQEMSIELSEDAKWVSLKSYVEENGTDDIKLKGFLFAKTKFGRGVAVCVDKNTMLWLPERYVDIFDKFTAEEKEYIQAGKAKMVKIDIVDTKAGKETVVFNLK